MAVGVLPVDVCCFFSGTDIARQAIYVKLNIAARSRHYCCRVKAIIVIYSEYVSVASVTKRAIRKCLVMLSSVASLAETHFSTVSHKQHDFWKMLFNKKNVFPFSIQFRPKHFSL